MFRRGVLRPYGLCRLGSGRSCDGGVGREAMVALEKGMMGQARRVALACHAHGVDQTGAAQLVQHSQRLEDTGELGMVGCQASHVVGRPATNRLEQHAQLCLELQTKR